MDRYDEYIKIPEGKTVPLHKVMAALKKKGKR